MFQDVFESLTLNANKMAIADNPRIESSILASENFATTLRMIEKNDPPDPPLIPSNPCSFIKY